jgi:hypothetical protein
MIIVIEGADGCGKTTLAEKLKEVFPGSKYIHATWSRELDCRMLEYHMGILSDAYWFIQETNLPVIIDRLWLSEAVYAQVFRSGSKYPKESRLFDYLIEKIGGINIICLADDLQAHADRFDELKVGRDEMYGNVSKVAYLYNEVWKCKDDYLLNNGYLKTIAEEGGLYKRQNYFRYSIENEGRNIDGFVSDIKAEFELINPYWGRK